MKLVKLKGISVNFSVDMDAKKTVYVAEDKDNKTVIDFI